MEWDDPMAAFGFKHTGTSLRLFGTVLHAGIASMKYMDLLINITLWSIMNDSCLLSYVYETTSNVGYRHGKEEGFSITVVSQLKVIQIHGLWISKNY